MLYDILIIDDDFDPEGDSLPIWEKSANKLLADLIRDNLRVTWTSGEDEDIKELVKKDLSAIKYIFCDLYLRGISDTDNFSVINSKIIGIMDELCIKFSNESFPITIYINSKHLKDGNYGDKGIGNLKDSLANEFEGKFSVEVIKAAKNDLDQRQKEKMIQHILGIYLKSMIIDKAIEVEEVFSRQLCLGETARSRISFESKNLVFESQFLNKEEKHKRLKQEINLLQTIRNELAHNNIGQNKIKVKDCMLRIILWGMLEYSPSKFPLITKNVPFENLESLAKYIESINELIKDLENIERKTLQN